MNIEHWRPADPLRATTGSFVRVYIAMGIVDRLGIYKMVYITRFSQPYDIEAKKRKKTRGRVGRRKTVHSYSYLETIDTVNS